jgi:CRISPR-associated protein Csb1
LLVPQIEVSLGNEKPQISLLDLAHRAGDAVVRATPGLVLKMDEAFGTLKRTGNAEPLARLAPTSLVFGVWDSRGATGQKCPRLVRAVIRAYDVDVLHSAAQFNSVWKSLSEEQQAELKEEEGKKKRYKRSEIGLADAPATFRKTDKVPQFKDGRPNPDARVLGGIIARGTIVREVTVNLVALRSLGAENEERSKCLRRYLLGLSLIAATVDQTMYLREGCHLRYADNECWQIIPRRGKSQAVDLHSQEAGKIIHGYARKYHAEFKPEDPKETFKFDVKEARKLLVKKDEDEQPQG